MAMLFDAKRNIIRRIATIVAVALLGCIVFFGYRAWQYYQYMDELRLDEDIAIETCIKNWGGYIEVSREVELRLQVAMPNPQRYLVIKAGNTRWGLYWFRFFGIDKTRGYLLMSSDGHSGLIEKSYTREEAEIVFAKLTQDYESLSNYSDIRSHEPVCNFMKVAFPATSKQVQIIGSFDESEDEASVVLNRNAYQLLFKTHIEQVYSNRDVYTKAVTASYERDRKAGRTRADYQNQIKRATENIFFELPDVKSAKIH